MPERPPRVKRPRAETTQSLERQPNTEVDFETAVQLLGQRFQAIAADHGLHAVVLSGTPDAGKTTLIGELRTALTDAVDVVYDTTNFYAWPAAMQSIQERLQRYERNRGTVVVLEVPSDIGLYGKAAIERVADTQQQKPPEYYIYIYNPSLGHVPPAASDQYHLVVRNTKSKKKRYGY